MASPARETAARCPECDTNVRFPQPPKVGQTISCPECKEVLEVVDLDPLELDWAYDSDDDWDDDDDDELEYEVDEEDNDYEDDDEIGYDE